MQTPTQEQVTRLVLVRYLLRAAEEQSKQQHPLDELAILSVHDAIEMFLDVASEAIGVDDDKRKEFMQYWSTFENAPTPTKLPMRGRMKKINEARRSLKHHGVMCSSEQIREFVQNARAFLEASCILCFDTPISDISLVDIIKHEKAKDHLKKAIAAADNNDVSSSLNESAIALALGERAFKHLRLAKVSSSSPMLQANPAFDKAKRAFVDLAKSVESIASGHRRAILMVSLGIDLRRMDRFMSMTPPVYLSEAGSFRFVGPLRAGEERTVDDARWCIDFAIDFMLRMEAGTV